jgi:cytidine deaminase
MSSYAPQSSFLRLFVGGNKVADMMVNPIASPPPIEIKHFLRSMDNPAPASELVFGLVGPLGTDLSAVAQALKDALAQVRYESEPYRLSRLMRDLSGEPWSTLEDGHRDTTIDAHMTAGNKLRETLGRNDAMAMLGLIAIQEFRQQKTGEPTQPLPRFAHILNSLKRPEEVKTLRRIYGPSLVILAAYAPRPRRLQDLARRIAESRFSNQSGDYLTQAERLLRRDESEIGDEYGQNVEETFPIADIVINTTDHSSMVNSIQRAIELLFGNVFITPSSDEQGMYLARAAALRSGSLARQVGAAICRQDGTLVALGMNEVPKTGGGAYWCLDENDGRDFRWGYDTSDRMRENIFGEILTRLKEAGWFVEAKAETPIPELVAETLRGGEHPIMKGAQFLATIDYVRAVHAEMAAIADAARYGVPTTGCTLYTTTFPCHDCAKHIIAAGITRVVYVEPYRKSLVQELYPDSVVVDPADSCAGKVRFEPFVGVAPRRCSDLFGLSTTKRKGKDGTLLQWRRAEAVPRLPEYMPSAVARLAAEQDEIRVFFGQLKEKGLAEPRDEIQS